jgi:hypothetical protein
LISSWQTLNARVHFDEKALHEHSQFTPWNFAANCGDSNGEKCYVIISGVDGEPPK